MGCDAVVRYTYSKVLEEATLTLVRVEKLTCILAFYDVITRISLRSLIRSLKWPACDAVYFGINQQFFSGTCHLSLHTVALKRTIYQKTQHHNP